MGLLLAAEEFGFRLRARMRPDSGVVEKADIAFVLGAILTLLALLLGFTYAMSQARYDTRRQLVVDEANAIGTAYLRAKTLPEPRSSEIQELLRQYAALRVEIISIKDDTPQRIQEVDSRSKHLHSLLWEHVVALARQTPNPITSVFIQSLNEMIDLHAKRLAAYRNRVPLSIYLVLFLVSIITMFWLGYYFGRRIQRARIFPLVVALLVGLVMWLILDLDQPRRGIIQASQQSLIDLYQDMSQDAMKKP